MKLTRVDDLNRLDHAYITPDDSVWFLREYTSGVNYQFGETNNIVSNLKKKVDRRGKPEWRYKEQCIEQAGRELREAFGDAGLVGITIVPMPPSKSRSDPMYDDRVLRIVQRMTQGLKADVRELVLQKTSIAAAHEGLRPTPDELYENLTIDETCAAPDPTDVLVVDDVLTAGAHFLAIKRRLTERFPGLRIYGCFYARRVFPPNAPAAE